MKVTCVLLCSLLAAAAALPAKLNTIVDSTNTKNSPKGIQEDQTKNLANSVLDQEQNIDAPSLKSDQHQIENFDGPIETFASDDQQSNAGDSSGNHIQQPLFGASPFGALLNEETSVDGKSVDEEPSYGSPTSNLAQNEFPSSGGSADKPLDDKEQPTLNYGTNQNSNAGPNQQSSANQQPTFNAALPGQPPVEPFNVAVGGDGDFYLRTAFPNVGYQPTQYTSLDLSEVDFENNENSGHLPYITVPDDDMSEEDEVYRLVGVAPSSAVRGGSAVTYLANIGDTVPVYSELDDVYEHRLYLQYLAAQAQEPVPYSAQRGPQPWNVRAESIISGGNFVILLDD